MRSWAVRLGLMAVLMAAAVAGAAEPARPGVLEMIRDMRLTMLARRAIRLDTELNKLGLGVEVKNGIALVWGPIPNSRMGERAVSRLELIDGVRDVRTDFHVRKSAPPADLYAARKVELPTPPEKPAVPAVKKPSPAVVQSVKRDGPVLEDRIAIVRRADPRFQSVRITISGANVTVQRGDDDEAASLFAQRLQELPGVGDVILASR